MSPCTLTVWPVCCVHVAVDSQFLLYARKQEIRGVDILSATTNFIPALTVPYVYNPLAIDHDTRDKKIYWVDGDPTNSRSHHGIIRANLNGTGVEIIIDSGRCECLTPTQPLSRLNQIQCKPDISRSRISRNWIYRGRMLDPIFWRPRARYFSRNRGNSLDPIRGRQFFAKSAHRDSLCSRFAGDNFSRNQLKPTCQCGLEHMLCDGQPR